MIAAARIARGEVVVRAAVPSDVEAVWRWNFAPDVRAWSRRAEPVAYADHAWWFARRLAALHAPIWIIEHGGASVGVVRIDVDDEGRAPARISIALAGAARGRGLGRIAIGLACQAWARPVTAEILPDNARSRSCFEACGFRRVAERPELVTYLWEPENR